MGHLLMMWLLLTGIIVLAVLTVWVAIKLWEDATGQQSPLLERSRRRQRDLDQVEYDDDLFDLSPRRPGPDQVTTVRLADGREVLMVQQAGTNGMAVASLVLGLLGISLLALIFGFVALGQIERNPGQQGRGMAIAGIVLSVLWLFVMVALYALAYYAVESAT